MAQSVKRPTSAQVMISQFVSLSPASGSGLTAQGLEPASDSVSPPPSAPPLLMLCVSLSLNNKQMLKKVFRKTKAVVKILKSQKSVSQNQTKTSCIV